MNGCACAAALGCGIHSERKRDLGYEGRKDGLRQYTRRKRVGQHEQAEPVIRRSRRTRGCQLLHRSGAWCREVCGRRSSRPAVLERTAAFKDGHREQRDHPSRALGAEGTKMMYEAGEDSGWAVE